MTDPTQAFIRAHAGDDIRRLALQARKYPDVDIPFALRQIEGRQRIRTKVPAVWQNEEWLYPPSMSLEQCSSEATARYKAKIIYDLLIYDLRLPAGRSIYNLKSKIVNDSTLVDLTGGMGVDTLFLSEMFSRTVYVERDAELCRLARHNLPWVEVVQADAMDYAARMTEARCVMLDPARRDSAGRKVAALQDCSPNAVELLPLLRERTSLLLVKLSPMLDIRAALRELPAHEVHVLSVNGECKELLLVVRPQLPAPPPEDVPVYAADILTDAAGRVQSVLCPPPFTEREEAALLRRSGKSVESGQSGQSVDSTLNNGLRPPHPVLDTGSQRLRLGGRNEALPHAGHGMRTDLTDLPDSTDWTDSPDSPDSPDFLSGWLHEPNASVMKAGMFRTVAVRYGLRKLAPNTHLYTSAAPVSGFPGRSFRIIAVHTLSKRGEARLRALGRANISVRNFPLTAAQLRSRLRLADGGDHYLFATTLADGRHVVIEGVR